MHAGYVGLPDFDLSIAAALVGFETFSPQLLMVLSIQYLCNTFHIHGCLRDNAMSARERTGMELCLALPALVDCARTLAIVICAALHRRHLMIWAVFAPKLAIEALSSLAAQLAIVLASFWI